MGWKDKLICCVKGSKSTKKRSTSSNENLTLDYSRLNLSEFPVILENIDGIIGNYERFTKR